MVFAFVLGFAMLYTCFDICLKVILFFRVFYYDIMVVWRLFVYNPYYFGPFSVYVVSFGRGASETNPSLCPVVLAVK